MNDAFLIQMTTQLLWVVIMLSLPVVAAVALVSLLVGLLQALTQLQDQSLQFIFKLITTSVTLLVTYHWISTTLLNYSNMAFQHLSSVGH
jgi:type III secretion protein S